MEPVGWNSSGLSSVTDWNCVMKLLSVAVDGRGLSLRSPLPKAAANPKPNIVGHPESRVKIAVNNCLLRLSER